MGRYVAEAASSSAAPRRDDDKRHPEGLRPHHGRGPCSSSAWRRPDSCCFDPRCNICRLRNRSGLADPVVRSRFAENEDQRSPAGCCLDGNGEGRPGQSIAVSRPPSNEPPVWRTVDDDLPASSSGERHATLPRRYSGPSCGSRANALDLTRQQSSPRRVPSSSATTAASVPRIVAHVPHHPDRPQPAPNERLQGDSVPNAIARLGSRRGHARIRPWSCERASTVPSSPRE